MKIVRLIICFIFISNVGLVQSQSQPVQFDSILNQFINVRDFCISKDGQEAFFTIQSPNQEISQLAYITKENNTWTAPQLLPFCDAFMYLEPYLSYDNNRLYFASDRPLNATSTEKKDFDIWYVDRANAHAPWSAPKNLGLSVNSELDEFYPSVSKNNNLYFTMVSPTGFGKDDIYVSTWENGSYSKPIILDANINSEGYEFNAFISANEDFIIFSKYNEADGLGSGDLYISKKDANGNWQKPKNLGDAVNSKFMDYCPYYDEENQMLYFTSKRNSIQQRKFESISDFTNHIMKSDNGLSKIYKTSLIID
ncbi:WD40 repeat protein [Gelidibacter sediminis]|uniref:WD40 repeat protein n=1 Tax=Gelidibacter sediminis TaxID=1608710 RepID=A0A4R7PIW1_9FLAO|nr:PD40 domain-containing protein [Gelidibacter sediminis]TDU34298.1 WD40 repeat protein [Gelidibacter sediminis]